MKALIALLALVFVLHASYAEVLISEVLAHTDAPEVDWIEFHNNGTLPVDMSGWRVADTLSGNQYYTFPTGYTIGAGEYKSLRATVFAPQNYPTGFRFSSIGETAYLIPAGTTTPSHSMEFPASRNGWTFIFHTGADGVERLTTAYSKTEAAPNSYPLAGANQGVAITEINFAPLTPTQGYWVKITNVAPTIVQLFDPANPTHTFHITGIMPEPANFSFPQNVVLQPKESLYVTSMDRSAFLTLRSLPDETQVFTEPAMSMSSAGGEVILWAPDIPNINPNTSAIEMVPYYFRDRVVFGTGNGYPTDTVGTGHYMVKIADMSYGNDAVKWRSSSTPHPTCPGGNATECPEMDYCTVAACVNMNCEYSLRVCQNIQSEEEAALVRKCFPNTQCVYTPPLPGGNPPGGVTGSASFLAPALALIAALLIAVWA